MIPTLKKSGLLPAGVHKATWVEFTEMFGFNAHRHKLLEGLRKGLEVLRLYGCNVVFVGGSFVTSKPFPNDVDVCYDNTGMNWKKFLKEHPEFNDIKHGSSLQKEKYLSEFYGYNAFDNSILKFFQFDRNNSPKGVVKISLTGRL
ncbi:MAG: hypothetical protein WAT19_08660 [Ferruginibacter sp.]